MESIAVVGMDLHKAFSKAVLMTAEGEPVETVTVGHDNDHAEMRAFFERCAPHTDVVMEATFNWPWVVDLAEAQGLSPHLMHAARGRALAKGMGKNDRKDATFMGKLWLAGGDVFPEAYLAPPAVRARRARFRTRALLVAMRCNVKNSIHGILHKCGVVVDEAADLFSPKGLAALQRVPLPPTAQEELTVKLAVVHDLTAQIKAVEFRVKQELAHDPQAALLKTLPGVGDLVAYGWLAEIGDLRRFPNGRALAAYAGVLPLDNESAGTDFGKHTSRRCNQHLKLMALEAVTGAVRSSPRMKSLYERVKARNKHQPGKARVAVARELLELAHLLLRRQVPYQEAPPPRPGRRASARSQRTNGRHPQDALHPDRASQRAVSTRSGRSEAGF